LPIIGAIFIKLTRDIAQFGIESLKTILGINQQVRERQALEQAVVNTLIQDQQVMASILALSGNRAKQEEYLLGVYNRQLNALQQVKNIAATVTPALMSGGLTATSGRIERRGAGGYLPAQEAADVRRGVGGANPSSKVVSIPNFAFGGGKRGTMIANTSEYIVPNFANGGSAIFNKDMARAYGLPAGAKKISAAGGYVPNFARYVYDADRIQPDKNALLKAILASGAKKNLIVGPAGSGKSTYGASLGSFITNPAQLADATEIDILSGAARTKEGGISKNFQQIANAVNMSGGKISYLYAGNMDILSRRMGRIGEGPSEGDLRSKKQIAGSMYAPLNQFDFISKVKGAASNFEMVRGAKGYVPNFATSYNLGYVWTGQGVPNIGGKIVDTPNKTESGETLLVGNQLRMFKKDGENLTQKQIEDLGWRLAKNEELKYFNTQKASRKTASSIGRAAMLIPSGINELSAFAEPQVPENKDYSSVSFPIYNLKENRLKTLKGQTATIPGYIDELQKNTENIGKALTAKLIGSSYIDDNIYKKAWEASYGAQSAVNSLSGGLFEAGVRYLTHPEGTMAKDNSNTLDFPNLSSPSGRIVKNLFDVDKEYAADLKGSDSGSIRRKFASQLLKNGLAASRGYIPNFAAGSPLGDAINREMAAGVSPNKIRITQDGRLRNAGNPNGLAVINTRDEPNGKIPNFAKELTKNSKGVWVRTGTNQPASNAEIAAYLAEEQAVKAGSATRISSRADLTPEQAVSAGLASAIPSKSKDNQEKLNLGILKTTAVFGALTSASYMLEGSIKDTDSSILKFTKGLTDTAQKTSLGLTLGEGLKPVVEGLSNKLPGALGTFTKSLAGATPIIGAAIGGLMGLVDILEYITTEDKRKGAKTTEEFLGTISGLSTDKQIELVNKKIAEQQNIVSRGEESKQGYLSRADILRKSAMASAGTGAGFAGAVTQMTEEEKKMESQAQAASGSLEILRKRADELKKAQATQSKTEEEAQNKAIKDANERLVLAKELNNINITFAKRENGLMVDRLRKRIELNNSVILGTQAQKDDVALQQKLIDLEDQKTDANTNAVKQVINQLGTLNSLATVDKERLKTLMDRVQSSQKLEGFEKEIEALGKEGAANARKMIEDQKASLIMTNMQLDAKKQEAELNDRSERSTKAILDREKLITDQILKRMDFQDQLSQERRSFAKESASLGRQLPLRQLEATISQVKIEEERAAITEAASKRQEDSYISLKKSILDTVPSLEFLGKKETDNITNRIAQINLIEDEAKKYEELQKLAKELTNKKLNVDFKSPFNKDELARNVQALSNSQSSINSALTLQNEILRNGTELDKQRLKLVMDTKTFEEKIAEIRARSKPMAGFARAFGDIEKESVNFSETFAYNTTNAFRDGLRDAMSEAISQTDDLGSALQNVAMNFLKTMQSQFLNQAAGNITTAIGKGLNITGMAKGGLVTGGSGYRDDVPRMLTGGEFVMRKSAVQKYGAANLAKMNNGGIFLPGVRGGGNINGYDQLRAFANQTTTSGATDILRGGGSSAFINLEDQSSRLSRFALLGDDTINQEIRSAQEQGLNIIAQREAYRTQQRKAFQQQLLGTIASAALSAGIGKLMAPAVKGLSKLPISYGASANPASYGPMAFGPFTGAGKGMFKAYGGMIRRYASGGPTDDIPALLMSGEYVMNRGATSKYGKRLLDSMNQGRAPRFADGGEVGASTTTTESNAKMMGDVSININVTGQNSQTETQGNTNQGGIDYKKMSERIKAVVLETINEEKRLGGSLRPGR
jgi:hypothetical protein